MSSSTGKCTEECLVRENFLERQTDKQRRRERERERVREKIGGKE